MALAMTINFEEELRKHEANTTIFNNIKTKKFAFETSQQALAAKQTEKERLSTELTVSKENYKTQYSELDQLVSQYNTAVLQTKDFPSGKGGGLNILSLVRAIYGAENGIDREAEYSWGKLAVYEASELNLGGDDVKENRSCEFVKNDAARNSHLESTTEHPLSIAREEQLEDVYSKLTDVRKQAGCFKHISEFTRHMKDLTDLRAAVEEQRAILLVHKSTALLVAKNLKRSLREIKELQGVCDLKKQEFEVSKADWANQQMVSCKNSSTRAEKESHCTTFSEPKSDTYTSEELKKQIESQHIKLLPLLKIGVEIRLRRFEQLMKAQDQNREVITHGNTAAHEGRALADALLFHSSVPIDYGRYKTEYIRVYGFDHSTILKFRDCGNFSKVLDWKGSMEEFRKTLPPSAYEFKDFDHNFELLKTEVTGLDVGGVQAYFRERSGLGRFQSLCRQHGLAQVRFKLNMTK